MTDDILAAGAFCEDSAATGVGGLQNLNSAQCSGALYLYRWRDEEWSQKTYVKASNTNALDYFGDVVAIDGDLVAVGAPYEQSAATGVNGDESDNTLDSAGAAYVFVMPSF